MTITRRTLLGAGVAAAAVPLVSGCNTVTRSTDIAALNRPAELPTYRRYAGPQPDLPRTHPGIPDAFRRFPRDPRPVTDGRPPATGGELLSTVQITDPIPPSMERNRFWQELNRRVGADLRLNISPGSDWHNKFAAAVAGDTLGDIYNVSDRFSYTPQLLEAKAQDLTEYVTGDAVLDYPFLANIPTESWALCVFAGAIRAVPVPRGPLQTQVLYVRKDLTDRLGVEPEFRDVEGFVELARAVTDGRRNRWALATVPMDVLGMMHGLPNTWRESGGKLTHKNELEPYQDALAAGARLVKEGLTHPDAIGAPNQKLWFNQGTGVMTQDTYSATLGFYQQNIAGPAFEIALPVLPGPDGTPASVWLAPPINSVTGIKPGSPGRVRELLEVLNWLAAPFGSQEYLFRKFGVEGQHFTFRDGEPVLTGTGRSETSGTGFPTKYLTDGPMPIYFSGQPKAAEVVHGHLTTVIAKGRRSPVLGLVSPTQSTRGQVLDQRLTSATNDILLGRAPVSGWKAVMADWRKGGGDKIRGEFEQALAVRNGA